MFLAALQPVSLRGSFLCTCRDVSLQGAGGQEGAVFSLHMQRCFSVICFSSLQKKVFSAHAEMFLACRQRTRGRCGFLCTCRDVSVSLYASACAFAFSLHMQRCFCKMDFQHQSSSVFSAHAEMFLYSMVVSRWAWSFLCTCRDVSKDCVVYDPFMGFSLHMQRCFPPWPCPTQRPRVFSAHAEMFPSSITAL